MADLTVMHLEQFEELPAPGVPEGLFRLAGKSLGIQAWGMNVLTLPPGWTRYPEHDHADDGHEEVYVVFRCAATLLVGEESVALAQGTFARVGPQERRKLVAGPEGVTLIALGGTPGKAYQPSWGRAAR